MTWGRAVFLQLLALVVLAVQSGYAQTGSLQSAGLQTGSVQSGGVEAGIVKSSKEGGSFLLFFDVIITISSLNGDIINVVTLGCYYIRIIYNKKHFRCKKKSLRKKTVRN